MSVGAARRVSLGALAVFIGILTACAGPAKNPACNSSGQCASGLTCKANECVSATQCPSTQASCSSNASCEAGSSCQSGCCAPLAAGACRTSSDCTDASKPHCDSSDSTCKGCADNTECPASTICTPSGACLQGCSKDANCASGQHCFAGTNGSWCGQCQNSGNCIDPSKPFCSAGVCTGCNSNSDCSGATPVCNTSTHGCVACIESQNAAGVNSACADSAKPACVAGACQACAPSSDDSSTHKNPACGSTTPYCNPAGDVCQACIDNTQCPSGGYCGGDNICHTPALTTECIGSGATCTTTTTLVVGSITSVTASLDVAAVVDTTVTFDFTSGAASFDSSSSVVTTTATIPAGSTATPAVNVYLNSVNTNDVTVRATVNGVHQTVTIHIQSTPAALSNFTSDQANVQEGQTATLTVAFDAVPASTATVTLTNDDPTLATIPASVDVSGTTSNSVTFNATPLASGTVHMHAVFNGVTKDLNVNVFKVQVTNLTASNAQTGVGTTDQLTVTIDSAPPGGASAIVSINGTGGAGTVPSTVTVAASQTTANFDFTAGASAGSESITASAGGATSAAVNITVAVLSQKVMVICVDGGGAALSTGAAAVFVEEYDSVTPGTPVRTITVPTAVSGSNQPLTMTGNSTTEGGLSRSADGKYVSFAGYAAAAGTASVAVTSSSTTARIVGRINSAGTVDTSTQMNSVFNCTGGPPCTSAGNVRGATSLDGSNFWVTGSNTGVVYVALGSTGASTIISTGNPTNLRHAHIFNSQLYITSGSSGVDGVATVGSGTPTTAASSAITLLSGFPSTSTGSSPYSFAMIGTDTVYMAQNPSSSGTAANIINVQKYKLNGSSWTQDTAFLPALSGEAANTGAMGLTAFSVSGGNRIVASTSDGKLVTFVDDGVNETPAVTVLNTAAANTAYRGVALSPTP